MNISLKSWKRWLPTFSKPLVAAVIGSALTWGFQKLGIVALPSDIQSAVTPLVGILTGAIVNNSQPTAPPTTSLGTTLADALKGSIAQVIDANPALVHDLVVAALTTKPVVTANAAPTQAST